MHFSVLCSVFSVSFSPRKILVYHTAIQWQHPVCSNFFFKKQAICRISSCYPLNQRGARRDFILRSTAFHCFSFVHLFSSICRSLNFAMLLSILCCFLVILWCVVCSSCLLYSFSISRSIYLLVVSFD